MLRATSHGYWWLVLIATVLIFSVHEPVGGATSNVNWQASQAAFVQIGIRDKNGSLGKFTAVFVLSTPDGRQYETKVTVPEPLGWGYVRFPDDLPTYSKPGQYSWKYIVDGREVVTGKFEFTTVSWYADQLRVSLPVFKR